MQSNINTFIFLKTKAIGNTQQNTKHITQRPERNYDITLRLLAS